MIKPLSRALTKSVNAVAIAAAISSTAFTYADQLDNVMKVGEARLAQAQKSQQKVDGIAEQTNDLLQTFKQVSKEIEGLRVYNAQLDARIANQLERIVEIDEAIANVKIVQRQIPPLLDRMLDGLDTFIGLDVPFHLEERQARVERLRGNMSKSNQSVSEIFRQVLEAYKIENEYGRKIEAYEASIDFNGDGNERKVDVFRVGRIALLYRTEDGLEVGRWDNEARNWEPLDAGAWSDKVNTGIRIARNQAVKDILTLPIAAPEAAQ
jgi:flagellar biosynthesis/type III secretory pathway chaperone